VARARDVELGDVARAPAPLGERERFAVWRPRASHEGALVVEGPQGEIGLRHLRLHQEPGALQQASWAWASSAAASLACDRRPKRSTS
jgi:hypothetical protein